MVFLAPPAWLENSSAHNAQDLRAVLGSLILASVVADDAALTVTEKSGTPNMSVDIAVGGAFVKSTRADAQGVYHAYNDGVLNVAVSAADPTNDRIDRVLVQVRDEAQDAALTQNDARIFIEEGTPAATPSAPTISIEDYVELAQITVPAAATSIVDANITDLRTVLGSTEDELVFSIAASSPDTTGTLSTWPGTTHDIDIPAWATRAVIFCTINYFEVTATTVADVNIDLDGVNSNTRRIGGSGASAYGMITFTAEFDVSAIAGTTVTLKTEAIEISGGGACRPVGRDMTVRFRR